MCNKQGKGIPEFTAIRSQHFSEKNTASLQLRLSFAAIFWNYDLILISQHIIRQVAMLVKFSF